VGRPHSKERNVRTEGGERCAEGKQSFNKSGEHSLLKGVSRHSEKYRVRRAHGAKKKGKRGNIGIGRHSCKAGLKG